MKTRHFLPLLLTLAAACQRADSASPDTERRVRDLIAATRPYDATTSGAQQTDWLEQRERVLDAARAGDAALGAEALRRFHERESLPLAVQSALLEVAAHTAPDEAAPVLVDLVATYGADLALRAEAARWLAVAAPRRALEVIEPILLDPLTDQTRPQPEVLLEAVLLAGEALDHDVSPILVDVATELYQPDDVRHRAVKELANHRGPRVEAAVKHVLTESTGNAYIRRLAARSWLACAGPERVCDELLDVLSHEADARFRDFLTDVVEKNCR